MIERMSENDALVTRYMNDPEFQDIVFSVLSESIFEEVRTAGSSEELVHPVVGAN